jgi:hypothetical protein
MNQNDEAVSSVVAMMLILAIIATLVAVYTATYLPGLKQQAEIEHIQEVRDAFVRFDTDVWYTVGRQDTYPSNADIKQGGNWTDVCRFSQPFSLGGGNVLLSPVKSSGTLMIKQEDPPLVEVFCGEEEWKATLANITYRPSFTTWEPQGYTWQEGYVNVTKGERKTPLLYRSMEEEELLAKREAFARSFFKIDAQGDPGECTGLVITLVKMHPKKDRGCITGNGMANLHLNASVREEISEGGGLTISVPAAGAPGTDPVRAAVDRTIEEQCKRLFGLPAPRYENVAYDTEGGKHTLMFTDPEAHPTVKIRTVDIGVGAW